MERIYYGTQQSQQSPGVLTGPGEPGSWSARAVPRPSIRALQVVFTVLCQNSCENGPVAAEMGTEVGDTDSAPAPVACPVFSQLHTVHAGPFPRRPHLLSMSSLT